MRIRALVLGSFSIVLIIVFFTVFRGMSNFLNAFLVPMTLFVFLKDQSKKEIMTVFIAALFLVLFLFQMQTIFFIFYGLVSMILIELNKKDLSVFLSTIIVTFSLSLSFYLATVMTDYLFMTKIREFTIIMVGGSPMLYALYLLIFGLLMSLSMMIAIRLFTKIGKSWRILK